MDPDEALKMARAAIERLRLQVDRLVEAVELIAARLNTTPEAERSSGELPDDPLPQRFVPAREGDIFLPIRYAQNSLAGEIASTRNYERGNVLRTYASGDAWIPAIRHPDGSVIVLETDEEGG